MSARVLIHRVLASTSLLSLLLAQGDTAARKTYRDPEGRFTVAYPQTWHLDTRAKTFRIYSFTLDQIRPQFLLPDGGAMIVFSLRPPGVKSLDEWIEAEIRRQSVNSRRIFTLSFQDKAPDVRATETVSRWGSGDLHFEEVSWYFSADGLLLAPVLLYLADDPGASSHRDTFKQVVFSLTIGSKQLSK